MAYPCGDCGKNCTCLCVACDQCETWFHNTCQKLTKDQFCILRTSPNCDYICLKCCRTNDGYFDFDNSIKRLEKYAKANVLLEGSRVEQILFRNENLELMFSRNDFKSYTAASCLTEDRTSKQILEFFKMSIENKKPMQYQSVWLVMRSLQHR